jgi:hypothetical protein
VRHAAAAAKSGSEELPVRGRDPVPDVAARVVTVVSWPGTLVVEPSAEIVVVVVG